MKAFILGNYDFPVEGLQKNVYLVTEAHFKNPVCQFVFDAFSNIKQAFTVTKIVDLYDL